MAAFKNNPITKFQKGILDEYYANGFESIKAYCKVKGIKEPKDEKARLSISAIVSSCKKGNPDYIAKLEANNDKKYGKMRDRLVGKLENVADTYEELVNIAMSDGELSEDDELKFRRLKAIMTTKDYNKAVELIGRLTGSFEPEKVDVTQTFTVDWGGTKLSETTKPVIDIDYEDADEDE